jgi:hypothetical protein
MKCSACGGERFEEGFVPDVGTAQTWVALWVAGKPSAEKSFWERVRTGGGIHMEGVDAKVIEAQRCAGCGHLELFATRAPIKGESLA